MLLCSKYEQIVYQIMVFTDIIYKKYIFCILFQCYKLKCFLCSQKEVIYFIYFTVDNKIVVTVRPMGNMENYTPLYKTIIPLGV